MNQQALAQRSDERVPASQVVKKARRGHEQYQENDGATPFVYLVPSPKGRR